MAITCCFSASDVCKCQNDDACQTETEAVCPDSACSETAAIIGGVVAIVFMIITALTVIVIVVPLLKSRIGKYSTTKPRYISTVSSNACSRYVLVVILLTLHTEKQVMLQLLLWNSPRSQRQPMSNPFTLYFQPLLSHFISHTQ